MSIWPNSLYVDKQQSTFSSALVAWGIARLLADLLERMNPPVSVRLRDFESCFQISTPSSFTLSQAPFVRLLRQIRTEKQFAGLSEDAYDYEAYRKQEQSYFAALESLRKEGTTLALLPQDSED